MDFVVAGQAFHWFRPPEARVEFARILKPGGWAVLVWHDRDIDSTPFLRAYEDFLRQYSNDYEQVTHKYLASYEALQRFFAPNEMTDQAAQPAAAGLRRTARATAVVVLHSQVRRASTTP